MAYRLLERFRGLFDGTVYLHRISTNGDHVAVELFEDIYNMGRASHYVMNVDSGLSVLNRQNKRQGVVARRGDGTLGEIVHGISPVVEEGFTVKRGPTATIQIGIEVKIMQKAMIKQIDRVMSDLEKQLIHFKSRGGDPICVGIVGINQADYSIGYEGDRQTRTTGTKHKHPIQEAADTERRMVDRVARQFDEFIILKYSATNDIPYPFSWLNPQKTEMDYAAALTRIRAEFQRRF